MTKELTEEIALEIAAVAHTANRIYCNSIGDFSQVPWELAPGWQKDSGVLGVMGVILDDKDPRQSHQNWFDHKVKEGWTFGQTKDEQKKTHPCLLPYDMLTPEQKAKDHLFVSVVKLMGAYLNVTCPAA